MPEMLSKLGCVGTSGLNNGLTKIKHVGRDLSFSDVLKARLEHEAGVKFSAHAMDRLNERGITLEREELARLSGAVSKAEEKGVNESLILIDDKAFIVSIANQTLITAMTGESIKSNVFTHIDSAVIA